MRLEEAVWRPTEGLVLVRAPSQASSRRRGLIMIVLLSVAGSWLVIMHYLWHPDNMRASWEDERGVALKPRPPPHPASNSYVH